MKRFALAFLLVTSPALSASFTGSWSGTGQATMRPGTPKERVRACSSIELALKQSEEKLELFSGDYVCEDLKAGYDPASFELHGEDVFYQGKAIGKISGPTLSISYLDPDDGSTFNLTLTRKADSLAYLEEWIQGGAIQLRVQGVLVDHSGTSD